MNSIRWAGVAEPDPTGCEKPPEIAGYHVGKMVVGEPRMLKAQEEGEEEEEEEEGVVVVVVVGEGEGEGCWIAGNGATRAVAGQAGQWRASRRDWAARIGVVGGSEAGRWDDSLARNSPEGRAVAGPLDCNPLLPAAANPIGAEGQAAMLGEVGPCRRSPDSAAAAAAATAVVGGGIVGNAVAAAGVAADAAADAGNAVAAAGVAAGAAAGAGAEDGTAAAAVGENW